MKKASEYRQHAQDCRDLAAQMPSEAQRALMLEKAEHWDKLAADRITLIEKHPELAHQGERDEERSWRSGRYGSDTQGQA
jgi:bacterioferritin (cytochrome b1)